MKRTTSLETLVVALGHRAKHGKDTAANAILAARSSKYSIEKIGFADGLKQEVLAAFFDANNGYWKFLDETRNATVSSFMGRVKTSANGCWLWEGKKNYKGYGIVYTASQPNYRAHRFMWEVVLGNDSAPLIRHLCDVRNCVNPLHLSIGTPADNSADMVSRCRSATGEAHSQAELSDAEVEEIRDLYADGMTQSDLYRKFNSTSATISRIVNGLTRVVPANVNTESALVTDFAAEWLNPVNKEKVRRVLQHYGSEYRRAQDSYYWVKALQRKVRQSTAQVVLVTDMRFQNEFSWVKSQSGITVKVEREGFDNGVSDHPSEHQLDNAEFDAVITHGEGQVDHLKQCAVELFDMIIGWKSSPPEAELDFTVPEEVANETQSI